MTSVTKLTTALAVSLSEAEEVSRRLVLAIEPRKKYVLASFIGSEHDRLVTKGMSNAQIFKVTRPRAIWGGFDHIPIRSVGQHSRHFRHINRLSSQSEASQLSCKIGDILRLQSKR